MSVDTVEGVSFHFNMDECCRDYNLCLDESKSLQLSFKDGFSTSLGE